MQLRIGRSGISGVVTNSVTALPYKSLKLQLRPHFSVTAFPSQIYSLLVRNVTTDSKGRFNFRYLQPGTYVLQHNGGPGGATLVDGTFSVSENQIVEGIQLSVEPLP